MYIKYFLRVLTISILVSAGCGMFSPVDVEKPAQTESSATDPMNFSNILSGNKEEFEFFDYEDLFNSGFEYRAGTGEVYKRDRFMERLDEILSEYFENRDNPPDILWTRKDTSSNDNFGISDTVQLNSRLYSIVFQESGDTIRGEAEFILVYIKESDKWKIHSFTDRPLDTGISFFHPLYNDYL